MFAISGNKINIVEKQLKSDYKNNQSQPSQKSCCGTLHKITSVDLILTAGSSQIG